MRDPLSLLLLLATVAMARPTEPPVVREFLNSSDFAVNWNVSFVEPNNTHTDSIDACYRSCVPPCMAFTWSRHTKACLRANCSQLRHHSGSNITFLRLVDGIRPNETGDDAAMKRVIERNSNCLSGSMYKNVSGVASNLYRQTTNKGYEYFSDAISAKEKAASSKEILGRMVLATYDQKAKIAVVEKLCTNMDDCLNVLCRPAAAGNELFLRNMYELCGTDLINGPRTIGLVAKKDCCGATVPVYESTKNGAKYYYTTQPAEGEETSKDPLFYLWESPHNRTL